MNTKSVRFTIAEQPPEDWLAQFPEIDTVVLHILYQRGLRSQEELDRFLAPEYSRDQHDPFLFKDMRKVVERIVKARDNKERVLIYGDYDADGVCSTVLLQSALSQIGIENLTLYLPHRDTEGYGLNAKAVEKFIQDKIDLLITVDCGISNRVEVAQAADAGIDVIVTDHHAEPLELPDKAFALINPQLSQDNYPFAELAGVGVAFKVAQALGRTLELGEAFEKWLLDLVAVSTITDCMPLLDENRTLVKYGLVVLNKTKRPGLRALIRATHKPGTDVTTTTIGYRIGPWINAAGRMGHANVAVDLLLSKETEKLETDVRNLEATNKERQAKTETMFQEAKSQVTAGQGMPHTDTPVLFTYGSDWPLGLVGLVAGKLVTALHKPAFVMTSNNNEVSGSGRSVPGLNMITTLQKMEELFSKYGGHAMACGFTLAEGVTRQQFQDRFIALAAEALKHADPTPEIKIAAELRLSDINWDMVNTLNALHPFGEKNPEPIFLLRNVTVSDFQTVGATSKHLRLIVSTGQKSVKAIAFGFGEWAKKLKLQDKITIACTLEVNHWNGNSEIQIGVEHIEKA